MDTLVDEFGRHAGVGAGLVERELHSSRAGADQDVGVDLAATDEVLRQPVQPAAGRSNQMWAWPVPTALSYSPNICPVAAQSRPPIAAAIIR